MKAKARKPKPAKSTKPPKARIKPVVAKTIPTPTKPPRLDNELPPWGPKQVEVSQKTIEPDREAKRFHMDDVLPAEPEAVVVHPEASTRVEPEVVKREEVRAATLDEKIAEALLNLQVEVYGGTPALSHRLLTASAIETIRKALKAKGFAIGLVIK